MHFDPETPDPRKRGCYADYDVVASSGVNGQVHARRPRTESVLARLAVDAAADILVAPLVPLEEAAPPPLPPRLLFRALLHLSHGFISRVPDRSVGATRNRLG